MDLSNVATGLTLAAEGYWRAAGGDRVSYPEDGNELCLSVETRSFWFSHRNRVILAALRRFPPAAGPLFDVGAGNGFVAAAMRAAGIPVVAIEPNPVGAANAVRRGIDPVICGNFPSPDFRENVAGGIALFDVVEHIAGDVDYLASLAPYLIGGGRLYVTVPAHRWLWSGEDEIAGHQRRYTTGELRQSLHAAGYVVDYVTYIFSWLPLPMLLFRVLPSKLLGDRRPARAIREHTAGGSVSRRLLERSLGFEAALVAKGARIPYGASCLAVARRQPAS